MTTTVHDSAIRSYLATLDKLLDGTPNRELVVDGIRQHIADSLGSGPAEPARVRAVLDELGDPAAIAADARTDSNAKRVPFLERRSGAVVTVLLLTVGSFVVPFVGWVVGLGLLWFSTGWGIIDKLVATFTPILLIALLVGALFLIPAIPAAPQLGVIAGAVLGWIIVAIYLLRRFREGGRISIS